LTEKAEIKDAQAPFSRFLGGLGRSELFSGALISGVCGIPFSGGMTSLVFGCTLSGGLGCCITFSGDPVSMFLSDPLSGALVSPRVLTAGSEGAGWLLPLSAGGRGFCSWISAGAGFLCLVLSKVLSDFFVSF
jgi:hypothetical protein